VVGEIFHTIIKKQFLLLRDADRFWYERRYSDVFVDFIHTQTLREIIIRNTTITDDEL
jgi:dual oxidase